jgi:hypothetical protein
MQATAIAAIVALVTSFLLFGVLPACGVFVLLAIRFGARTTWLTAALSGLGITVMIWAIFAILLGLDLPGGIFFDGGS